MTVLPTAYFGSVGYYQKWVEAKNPIIEKHEHFVKQTLRSRCEILGPNGVQTLSIPINKTAGSKSTMQEIDLDSSGWRKIHLKSIETAYASAPFYDYYEMEIVELIHFEAVKLIDFNNNIHKRILQWLDLPDSIQKTSTYLDSENYEQDYRLIDFDVNQERFQKYTQVFRSKENCIPNLSILDLVLNQGPMARNWLVSKAN